MGIPGRLALVWGAAFGLRLLYIVQSQQSPFYDFPLLDAKTYIYAARMLALGDWSGGEQAFWQPPLYPYFLGLLYALFEASFTVPRLLQAALGATICLLIFQLGRRVFSPRVGWFAAGAAIFYGPFIFFEGEFLPPVLALFLNLLALLSLLWAIEGRARRLLLSGWLLGLSALCVANILVFIPVVALWLVWSLRTLPIGERMLRLVPLILGTVLALAPVTLRNFLVADDLVLISSNAGLNFYIGNNADYQHTVQIQPGPAWEELTSRPRVEAGITRASAQSQFFFAESWDFISSEPLAYLQLQFYKLYLFWNGDEIGRNQDIYFARQYSPVLQMLLWKYGLAFPFGLLAPLAILGMWLGWRRGAMRDTGPLLLLLFTGVYTLSVVAFFVSARYRLPVVPMLLIFAAYAGRELYGMVREGEYRGLIGGCVGMLILGLASNFRVGAMNMDGGAETHFRLGFIFEKKGLPINATAAYHRALELDPDIKWARYNLASLYARQGEFGRAGAVYRDFISRYPDVPRARLALGNIYLQMSRYPEAIRVYRHLLGEPGADLADLQGRLGYAHTQHGQLDQAVQAYEALIAVRPDSLQVRFQLGQLYEELERPAAARAVYEWILARDSTRTEVRYRLARTLFFSDQPQVAKSHLERAIAVDAQAIDARLLLAAQYIVERRARTAMDQVQAILALVPEHQQANRLAGHLQMALGDTLQGVEYLDRFTEFYREGRSAEIFKRLKKQWDGQINRRH